MITTAVSIHPDQQLYTVKEGSSRRISAAAIADYVALLEHEAESTR